MVRPNWLRVSVVVWIVVILFLLTFLSRVNVPIRVADVQLGNFDVNSYIKEQLLEAEMIYLRAKKARHEALKNNPMPADEPWAIVNLINLWDYMYPSFNCPHSVERIGRVGDGGKWVCGLNHIRKKGAPCLIYSYGVNLETSFEEEVLNRTQCLIKAFDHTVKYKDMKGVVDKYDGRFQFFRRGLGRVDQDDILTLKSEMELQGDGFIDILKVDVEGFEFGATMQMLKDFPFHLPIGQLLLEVHLNMLPAKDQFKNVMAWFERLEKAGLRPYRTEPNHFPQLYASMATKPTAMPPNFYEFSFLNVNVDHIILHG